MATKPPRKATRRRVRFHIRTAPGSKVFVAGSFNDWDPTNRRLRDKETRGLFRTSMLLPPGRHEYKFVVNRTWLLDLENPEQTPNGHDSFNSVLTVD